jgi:alkanesulfonate monooxygenase SsuD/methylene tetrahydromethanopterin reductase-like flavin-dependent oxidoreductase (luciferase family)
MQGKIDKGKFALTVCLMSLSLALARNLAARLAYSYAAAGFPSDSAAALLAARKAARAIAKQDRQDRQAAFAIRCQAASAKRQAANAKRQAKRQARRGRLTAKEAARFARDQAATQRLKASEERQRKARQARQAVQMAIGAERIRRAKEKSETRLTRGKRIAE